MRNLLAMFALLIAISSNAQKIEVKGRVVEENSNTGVPYTNIGVEGTFIGCASDEEGYFTLSIPQEIKSGKVVVSAIGYSNRSFTLSELKSKDFSTVNLRKEIYSVDAVGVTGQSLVAFRVVSDAAKSISKNYCITPIGLDFHYLGTTNINGEEIIREAIVEMSDINAYSKPSIIDAFKSRNYKFTQVNKNFKPYTFSDALHSFNELISFDVARMASTVFNSNLVRDYDLKIDAVTPYQNDSVWIISYKKDNPSLAYSGDYYASKIEGKLYILKSNNALIRHESHIQSSKNNPSDRSLFSSQNMQKNVDYHVVCIYQQFNGKYVLSYVSQDKQFNDNKNNRVKYSSKVALLKLNNNPININGRTYYEDVKFNKEFWNSFHGQ